MNQATLPTEDLVQNVEEQGADQPQENGKRKRQMSERQLAALAEGRKKRWLKKQGLKEEQKDSTEEESTDQSSASEEEESKSETEAETTTEPSTAEESTEDQTSSEEKSTQEDTESSEQTDTTEQTDSSESESEEEPPSPPVLKRQKAVYNKDKNEKATVKMLKYLQAKAQPYFNHVYV